jgi:hypothetical protein
MMGRPFLLRPLLNRESDRGRVRDVRHRSGDRDRVGPGRRLILCPGSSSSATATSTAPSTPTAAGAGGHAASNQDNCENHEQHHLPRLLPASKTPEPQRQYQTQDGHYRFPVRMPQSRRRRRDSRRDGGRRAGGVRTVECNAGRIERARRILGSAGARKGNGTRCAAESL